jgi:hypothetical protein
VAIGKNAVEQRGGNISIIIRLNNGITATVFIASKLDALQHYYLSFKLLRPAPFNE